MILENEIKTISTIIPHYKKQNNSVSKRGVDWHLDHSLKAILAISESLKKSDPKKYKWTFSFLRTIIFFIGHFPRGKAKAPKITCSNEDIDESILLSQFTLVKKQLLEIETLPENSNFKHPIFGVLNLKQTIKFLRLHTQHHLKITNEIISSTV
jgi:hypothetical protein